MSQAFHLDKKAVADSFGRAASNYDRYALLQREVADRLLSGLDSGSTMPAVADALDLGCGTGYCLGGLGRRVPTAALTGLDISAPMLRVARARQGPRMRYVCGDAETLPFASDAFDLVVSSLAIQWCADLPALFAELRRVARPGARLLLSTFGPRTLRELRRAWAGIDSHVHVNRFQTRAEIEAALRANGLHDAVVSEEERVLHYAGFSALGRELKAIGARNRNAGQPPGLTGRRRLERLRDNFEQERVDGLGVPVTWHLYYLDCRVNK